MAEVFFGDPFRRLLLGRPILREWPGSSTSAAMDWLETQASHIIRVNIPGLGKEDVKIQLEEGNVLEIKGEAKKEEEEEAKDSVWHAGERGKLGFERRVALPEDVRADQIKAHVENGVLTVVVPKEPVPAKQKPRSIPVLSKL